MSRTLFLSALSAAQPGTHLTYHTGLLMFDRQRGSDFQRIHGAAVAAMEAMTQGLCHLVQRRVARNTYDYIAVRT